MSSGAKLLLSCLLTAVKRPLLALVAAFVMGLCSVPGRAQVGTTWPVLHADPGNSDFVPLAGARDLVPRWQALQVRPVAAHVAIDAAGRLYTTTLDAGPCHLHALNADGQPLWCSAEVRWAFTYPAVAADGTIYVTDGTELFRFAPDGAILWRVPATARALGPVFSRDGHPLVFDQLGMVTAYDPADGRVVAQLWVPSATIPRPPTLPTQATLFKAGAPLSGWDPTPALLDSFIDAFFNFNTAVGNNMPAMDANGRLFIGVAKGPPPSTQGVFYGIDFVPPVAPGAAGSLSIACATPMGLSSSTSPALSADGLRIYAGDATTPVPQLRAFRTSDCSQAWSLGLEASSLASPTVDLDGRIFMNVNQKVFAFRDNGNSAAVLWQTSLTPSAQAAGYTSARVNSVLPSAANVLYAAASYFARIGSTDIPMAHVLTTLDPATGAILRLTPLGEEAASTPSIGPDGQVYVPSKPLVKSTLLGNPSVRPSVPPAQSGLFAFAPGSYAQLVGDGIDVALDFVARSQAAVDTGDATGAAVQAARARRQVQACRANLLRAEQRGELSHGTVSSSDAHLATAERKLGDVPADLSQAQKALQQAAKKL